MLTLNHLATLMALLLGERPETLQLIARNLREARLVASGGRGRGGARQEPHHVANMIIAACATDQVADAASAAATFANLELAPSAAPRQRFRRSAAIVPPRVLRMSGPQAIAPRELQFATKGGAKFGDVIASLVELAADGRLYSLLMSHLSEFVDRAEREHERIVVTRNGRPAAVLLAYDDLAALEETLDVLSDPEALADIRQADAEVGRGEVVRGVDAVRALRPRA